MSRITIARVYRVKDGSPLLEDITDSVPATGGRLKVEFVTDFDPADDGETRYAVVDSEHIAFTDIDETTDELVNITRGANSTVAAAHTAGTFVQAGLVAKSEKFADGFIDDDEALAQGVEIMRHLWRMYPVGDRDHDEMEVATVRYLDDDHPVIIDAPEDDRADSPRFFTWSKTGVIAVSTRPHRWPAPFGGHLAEFFMTLGEGGEADDDVIVDILKDGVSILTEKMTVPAGEWLSNVAVPTTSEIRKFDVLQVQIEQVGTTDKGSNPTIVGVLYPSEAVTAGRIEVAGPQGVAGTDGADGSDGLISQVRDEGVAVTDAGTLDFTGDGVAVSSDGSVITIDIEGGGGGGFEGDSMETSPFVSNTTTETELFGYTVPAGTFTVGQAFSIVLAGVAACLGGHVVTFRLKAGATVLASFTMSHGSSQPLTREFSFQGMVLARSVGASGVLAASLGGPEELSTAGGNANLAQGRGAPTVDTTVDQHLAVTVQWSAASASDAISVTTGLIVKAFE